MRFHWRPSRAGDVCRRLQDTLAEQGPAALRDDEAARLHLEGCGECCRLLEALAALDEGFDAMAPLDAPDELVESLLARDELREPAGTPAASTPPAGRPRAAGSSGSPRLSVTSWPRFRAAAAFALLAVLSVPAYFYLHPRQAEPANTVVQVMVPDVERQLGAISDLGGELDEGDEAQAPQAPQVSADQIQELQALGYLGGAGAKAEPSHGPIRDSTPASQVGAEVRRDAFKALTPAGGFADKAERRNEPTPAPARLDRVGLASLEARGAYDLPTWVGTRAGITFRGGSPRVESDVDGPVDVDTEARQRVRDRLRERLRSLPRGLREENEQPATGSEAGGKGAALHLVGSDGPIASPRELARRFLSERDAVDVPGRPAVGYWVNTYVPGDPALRFLQARLAAREPASLALAGDEPPRPHEAARQVTQPFDPPPEAALAVQLGADRAATPGETRLLVQVGLTGTPRRGGRRPAMNVALVLDPRDATPAAGAGLVALAGAFAEARDLGDRFRLIAGGELVAPDDLRRGPAVVAARDVLASDVGGQDSGASLADAVRLAIEDVAGGDDPSAPLGSSAVILATTRAIGGDEADEIVDLAHDSGVAGIPLSVIGVGGAVDLGELDALALAGQGSRRLLRVPAEAPALVDRELAAAGRAVARAVRLTVALAPGVRLVDVVGSRRHGEEAVDWVRETERAIDRRLARNLGIEADRGDDEAGVQIVIPTFYAGDRHAVLLDVVAPGPGPIADVTVRFKDLLRLENAVVRQRLELPRGDAGDPAGRGPLELNVLENLLAHRLRETLRDAGGNLADGDREAAARRLEEHRRLLAGLASEVPGLERDPDLGRDLAMLDDYLELLRAGWPETHERRSYLADSLRYAAKLKVLPSPSPLGGA